MSNQKSSWVDFSICETLLKHARPLWSESIFSQAGIMGNASETQKLEKKIHNLLDIKQSEEQSKILFVIEIIFFLTKPLSTDFTGRAFN